MYIEVIHNGEGQIEMCYCADTLPMKNNDPLFTVAGELPEDFEQARINIDTLTAMAIDAASGPVAIEGEVVNISKSDHIRNTYIVDMSHEITPPEGVNIPEGFKVRSIKKKI